jgi:hypothetical protein
MTAVPEARRATTSQESDVLTALYSDWSQIMATTPDITVRLLRSVFDEWHQPTVEPTDVAYADRRRDPAGADCARPRTVHRLGTAGP